MGQQPTPEAVMHTGPSPEDGAVRAEPAGQEGGDLFYLGDDVDMDFSMELALAQAATDDQLVFY